MMLPTDIHRADMQIAVARYLSWMPGQVRALSHELSVEGWAVGLWETPSRLWVNGVEAAIIDWNVASADILTKFPDLPNAGASRFKARFEVPEGASLFPDGFLRLNITGAFGEHRLSYRTAWYMADPAREPEMPTPERITRVIGSPDADAFRIGGATIAKRFEQLLLERFDRPLSSFESILDWGSGAGRITRYLSMLSPRVTGMDIDADNIQACQQSIPAAQFQQVALYPPCSFAAGAFDLVIGLSVLTHLNQEMEAAWLGELQRLTRPGALLLLSVHGLAQMALYDAPASQKLDTHRWGFFDDGANAQLQQVIHDPDYYRNTFHSPNYIMTHWSRCFDVLDILEGMAGNQDLVLLRRR